MINWLQMTGRLQTLFTLCLLMMTTLLPASAAGNRVISPDRIEGVTNVDAEGLIDLVSATPGLVLIDSRVGADRKDGFIEGSISLPDSDTNCATLGAHIPALDKPLLLYSNGTHCGRSAHAARIARHCGYTRIYWFRTGMEEWREKYYPLVK